MVSGAVVVCHSEALEINADSLSILSPSLYYEWVWVGEMQRL
jgi:hypothetical protein